MLDKYILVGFSVVNSDQLIPYRVVYGSFKHYRYIISVADTGSEDGVAKIY
jgi:hypothetical protein